MSRVQFWWLAFIFSVGLALVIWGLATGDRGGLAGGVVWLVLFWFSMDRVERMIGEDDD